jgi:hypothetical protein
LDGKEIINESIEVFIKEIRRIIDKEIYDDRTFEKYFIGGVLYGVILNRMSMIMNKKK